MEMIDNETFCISCHEMRDTVCQEYKETIHYSNRTGVRAICPDRHGPKEWHYKVVRKIQATNELLHKALGRGAAFHRAGGRQDLYRLPQGNCVLPARYA